jgi:hypothetical protein
MRISYRSNATFCDGVENITPSSSWCTTEQRFGCNEHFFLPLFSLLALNFALALSKIKGVLQFVFVSISVLFL